jgi:uncharacterized protein (TIGR03086 family)
MSEVEVGLLDDVLLSTEAVIRGVTPDQRGLPTPCPDYDVGALVSHLVGWLQVFAAAAAGEPVQQDPTAYTAGDDAADRFRDAARQAVAAFEAGAADGPIDLGHGPNPGQQVFGMMLMEYIGHGWDLAKATGQPVAYSDAAAQAALDAGRATLLPQYRGPDKPFGHELPIDESAPALDRFVAFAGRDPNWS